MIGIIDSGSTKADWCFIDKGNRMDVQTVGLSPYFYNTSEMTNVLNTHFENFHWCSHVEKLFFYGTGCKFDNKKAIVRDALYRFFPNAVIHVETDILGAARAMAKHESGIVCILGTGMNTCSYDGNMITENLPSLGYILGDEGSGAYFGKQLLNAYAYNRLPKALKIDFEKEYGSEYQSFLNAIYHQPNPNTYLARFMPFLSRHISTDFVQGLVKKGFNELIQKCLVQYKDVKKIPIHFVGSVGFYFAEILEEALIENGLKLGSICQAPIADLLDYHLFDKKKP